MEALFRFILVRPPHPVAEAQIHLELPTEFQKSLLIARENNSSRDEMVSLASQFADSESFVSSLSALELGAELAQIHKELRLADDSLDVQAVAVSAFGLPFEAITEDQRLPVAQAKISDSLIAAVLLGASSTGRPSLADGLRVLELLRSAPATLEAFDPHCIMRWLRKPLVLPPKIFPLRPASAEDKNEFNEDDEQPTDDSGPVLWSAIEELIGLDLSLLSEPGTEVRVEADDVSASEATSVPITLATSAPTAVFTTANRGLSAETMAVLKRFDLDPTTIPIDRVVSRLEHELSMATRAAMERTRIGIVGSVATPLSEVHRVPRPLTPQPSVPDTRGGLRSVGIADLLVVKHQLTGYEATDIAHIENVLRGESKRREHRRTRLSEQTTFFETETLREEERDLETTERFELSRAASEVLTEEQSLTAGLTVSGSYGPTVEFSASVEGSIASTQESSSEFASNFSREVTERSRTLVSDRIRKEATLRIVSSVEETNEHALDNSASNAHTVGIYQWLEKSYEAQVFNYGRRAMFDFVVPEPASFVIHALESGFADSTSVVRPLDFDLMPSQITPANYHRFVREWEATNVNPPPQAFMTVSKTFRGGPDEPSGITRGMMVEAIELPLPDDYEAVFTTAVSRWGRWEGDQVTIRLTVGTRTHTFESGGQAKWSTALEGETGGIPVAIRTFRPSSYTAAIEIKCRRTARAMEKWRLATHAALLQAYQQKRSAYEDALRELQARAGAEIAGRNPAENRKIERTELKRLCISMLTAQHFDLFGAIHTGAGNLPQPTVDEALVEGPYIRFFEQAFEWHNAAYVFYPYFWGRKQTWIDRFLYRDVDPMFADFLKAGAARVVVPARPGFERAVDYFLTTGHVWLGDEPPEVGSETYVPIVEELSEQLGAPSNEVPHGEPWHHRVPTSLVLLRESAELPKWTKHEGSWFPDET